MKIKKITKVFAVILVLAFSTGICYSATLPNPLGNVENIPELIGKIIKGVLGLVGSLALLMFIYGGITWMTSGGNEEKIKKGKQILTWAVLGIVMIFTSYSILNLVFEILRSPSS